MTRATVRALKKSVRAGSAPHAGDDARNLSGECALALLERSIGFGHSRLAVVRLAMAVKAGAPVRSEHWAYCRRVAGNVDDVKLRSLFVQAAVTAGHPEPTRPSP